MNKRIRFPWWLRWLRRRILGREVLGCVRCVKSESVGPDLLCEDCLTLCETSPDVAESWIQDD